MFVVRAGDVEIIDTWHVSGLAGTGSHDIACDKLFVPDYMTMPARDTRGGPHQGSGASDADVYKLPVLGLFAHFLAYPVLGIAQGAYDDYVETLREQVSIYSNTRVGDHITIQLKIAEAGALIDTGRSIMRESGIEAHRMTAAGETPSVAHKTRWRRDAAYAAKGCVRALDLVFEACGGTAIYLDNELQRRFRDIHAAAAQIQIVFDINGPEFSRVALGLEPLNKNI
jgi:alkylation response protein AidB-like acyl-CoA dehydrogenase